MAEVYTCVRGLGYAHKWEYDVTAPPDWKPNTQKFTVRGRRYDVCGRCGLERCYLVGAMRQAVVRYNQATATKFDVDERPTGWDAWERIEELKQQERAERRKERQGAKAGRLKAA